MHQHCNLSVLRKKRILHGAAVWLSGAHADFYPARAAAKEKAS